MKTLAQRLSRFLLLLFGVQLCVLGSGLWLSYLLYQARLERETADWAHLDPLVSEELVSHTIQGNLAARDLLVYELILRNQLSHASVLSPGQLSRTVQAGAWAAGCSPEASTNPTVCQRTTGAIVAFVPLIHSGEGIAYFVKEALRNRVVSPHFVEFSKYLLLTLVAACGLNLLGVVIYFRTSVNRELKRLLQLLSDIRSAPASIEPLPFETREFATMQTVLRESLSALEASKKEKAEMAATAEKSRVAFQVAHDIKSPLAALDVVLKDLPKLPEEERILIRSAVHRIRDIASGLLREAKVCMGIGMEERSGDEAEAHDLAVLIDSIISEKRVEYQGHRVRVEANHDGGTYGVFSAVDPSGIKRVISNLVNNAVEAIHQDGSVEVSVAGRSEEAEVVVRDTGRGIPAEILKQLGSAPISHGKQGGHGLGLLDASRRIEAWGGTLQIDSIEGSGTTVRIRLPRCAAPPWFVPRLDLAHGTTVAIVDDDESIHEIWKRRFSGAGTTGAVVKLVHFKSLSELSTVVQEGAISPSLFLIDYEFISSAETGLDAIERLQLPPRAILVTSHFDEPVIRERCLRLGVGMIPKGMAGFVPLTVSLAPGRADLVLIDDDPIVRTSWEVSLRGRGLVLHSFATPRDFDRVAAGYERATPLYLDVELGGGLNGIEISQNYAALGFTTIFLTTGHARKDVPSLAHVAGVCGKTPPSGLERRSNVELRIADEPDLEGGLAT